MKSKKPTMPVSEFQARISAILGGHGWQARWSAALDYSPQHVSRVMGADKKPPALPVPWVAILEMLEALPPDQWPLRWQR